MPSNLYEQDRRAYLQAMGVDVWTRRKPLALAGQIRCLFPDPADAQQAQAQLQHAATPEQAEAVQAQVGNSSEQSLTQMAEVNTEAPAAKVEVPEVPAPEGYSYDDRPAFRIWFYAFGPHLFIDTVPLLLDPRGRNELKRLVMNMSIALGHENRMPELFQNLDWPVFDHPRIRQSSADAREFMEQKLAVVFTNHPEIEKVFVMGSEAARYCGGVTEFELGKELSINDRPAALIAAGSEMLQLKELKRQSWPVMQKLKAK
ncbi:hypothetical protein [Salinibius halmophilus]|uniref:hypothetical protein n=1 Tax=Salinibius halmophilus TaxID=1853216 RepID=UPI000E67525B|nr:hypothetical protein [Salinibius halmophilus]